MNRRGFFKTILAGTVGLLTASLPSPAEPKPQHTIDVDMASGSDTTFVSLFDKRDGKLIDCWRYEGTLTKELLKSMLADRGYIQPYKNWIQVNDNYF